MPYRQDWHWYEGAAPAKKAVPRVGGLTSGKMFRPSNQAPCAEVQGKLNRGLRGWPNYSIYGTRYVAYRSVDHYIWERARHFLRRRYKVPSRGTRCFPANVLFG
jgi:hypothetical protein